MGQTGRLFNTRVEEHKKNLGRKCNYHNVLSDHREEYSDHDFDWNNVEILHSESNKGKRKFMEMLYIKREVTYSINLKTDLVKYNGCYASMIKLSLKTMFHSKYPWGFEILRNNLKFIEWPWGSFRCLGGRDARGLVAVSCWSSVERDLRPHRGW